ncbi:MAG: class I SAM-dependent methyltransferase [Acidimicrobiales bacterium]
MGEGAGTDIDQDDRFEIDGLEFVPSWYRPSQPGSLTLLKGIHMVARYERLLAPFDRPRMVELGISQGGSVALLALLARPERFVAVELSPDPVVPLLDALRDHHLADAVKPYFGVDQADRDRLTRIVADEFGDDPLDLVVDDASHRYDETVASFEVLFPRLRPGGVYVIEDWTGQDQVADHAVATLTDPGSPRHAEANEELRRHLEAALADPTSPLHHQARAAIDQAVGQGSPPAGDAPVHGGRPPVSRIALELALARAVPGDALTEVRLDENWVEVTRGPAELDPATFRLADLCPDHYGLLTAFPPPPA